MTIVTWYGRPAVWIRDPAGARLESPIACYVATVFEDVAAAEFAIRKTIERWPESERHFAYRVFRVLALEPPGALP